MPASRFRGSPRPQYALAAIFIMRGFLYGSWIARIPAIAALLGVNRTELGSVLIGGAIGALIAFQSTGPRVSQWGSAVSIRWFGMVWVASFLLPLFAPNPFGFFLAFLVYGFTNGTTDVSLNAQAVEIERHLARPILSTAHGMFNVGALAGGAAGAGFAALDVPVRGQFLVAVAVFVPLWAWLSRFLVAEATPAEVPAVRQRRPLLTIGPRVLWPLAAIALCAGLLEESLADWGALYLSEDLGANAGIAALGFTIFSGMSLLGRLAGDTLVRRHGPVLILRAGTVIAVGGIMFGAVMAVPWAFLVAFGLAGLGFSSMLPIVYRAAGSTPGVERSAGVSAAATACYAAFLIGPPVIGAIGDVLSLRVAFILVAIVATSVIALAPAALRPSMAATEPLSPSTDAGSVAPAPVHGT